MKSNLELEWRKMADAAENIVSSICDAVLRDRKVKPSKTNANKNSINPEPKLANKTAEWLKALAKNNEGAENLTFLAVVNFNSKSGKASFAPVAVETDNGKRYAIPQANSSVHILEISPTDYSPI